MTTAAGSWIPQYLCEERKRRRKGRRWTRRRKREEKGRRERGEWRKN